MVASHPPRLFLNYRTEDTGFAATLLYRELNARLADDQVFLDHARIEGGEQWPARLRAEMARATMVFALLGDRWLKVTEAASGSRRIDLDGDWVRSELEQAHDRGLTIVPILVEGARKPDPTWRLPASLAWLIGCQARDLRRVDLQAHVDGLAELLVKDHGFRRRTEPRRAADLAADLEPIYRQHVAHRHSQLVRYFGGGQRPTLQDVFVEPALRAGSSRAEPSGLHEAAFWHGSHRLRALLDASNRADPAMPRHWILRGDPGAGKSTLVRHLCHELAADSQAPLPVYVSLARWAREGGDVFDLTQATLARDAGEQTAAGLAALLRARAANPGCVWLLLDGYDEVADPGDIRARIASLAATGATVVVTTRPYAIPDFDAGLGFALASIEPLAPSRQRELLQRWLGADRAGEVFDVLHQRPLLADLCRNPLTLTWLALLLRPAGAKPPRSRKDLYDRVVRVYLEESPEAGGDDKVLRVAAPTDARAMLAALALALQSEDNANESWPRPQLVAALWDVNQSDRHQRVVKLWQSPDGFLGEVGRRSGLLAEFEGAGEGFRFLHRSLREFLVAEAMLSRETRTQWLARAKGLDDDSFARWAEPFAMLCAQAPQPAELVLALAEHNQQLALRCLPDIDVPFAQGLAVLQQLEGWDGDDLLRLARGALIGGESRDQLEAALWPWVTPDQNLDVLAYVHFALTEVAPRPELRRGGVALDRAKFFAACGRSLPAVPQLEFVKIPAGSFLMGSPEDETDRSDDEGPRHPVSVSPFELASTPITNAQYAAFDPQFEPEPWKDMKPELLLRHPAVNVSWWQAYLFCAWIGARLPSEAEWEYACRAGTKTRYWSGDTEEDLARVGWYDGNSGGRTHAVGEKPANAFGLHDVHGNVWEWCADRWHGSYEGAPADGSAWVDAGSARVVRGGSWILNAGGCRSAYRDWGHPSGRLGDVGFRPARFATE